MEGSWRIVAHHHALSDHDRDALEQLQRASSGPCRAGPSRPRRSAARAGSAGTRWLTTGYTRQCKSAAFAGGLSKPGSMAWTIGRAPEAPDGDGAQDRADCGVDLEAAHRAALSHWSSRDLAGIASACRIRRCIACGGRTRCNPTEVETFKFSTDPDAAAKITDVVGLYLQPPTNAVVLSVDEKTQIQSVESDAAVVADAAGPARSSGRTTTGGTG